jgi:hypothetical protein
MALHSLFPRRLAVLAGTRLSIAHLGDRNIIDWYEERLSAWAIDSEQMMQMITGFGSASLMTVIRQMENSPKELEALQKFVPFAPCTTSYRMGWKGLEAVRYRTDSASVEFTLPPVSYHCLVLISRPPEKLDVRYEG